MSRTINELNTTDTLVGEDKLVLWQEQSGATRAITAADAADYFSLSGGPYQPLDELLTAIAAQGPNTANGDFIQLTGQDTVRVRKLTVATYAALTVIPASFRFDDMLVYVASRATDGDGGEGWWRFDASSSATANGGTILAPDAGSGRWIRLETVFDVMLFGAKGDNTTDDTAAIQAAIDAAEAASIASSLVVCYVDFPRGVYRHTALTIETDRVVLRSTDGARLVKTSTTGDGIKFYKAAGRIFQNGIEGLTLAAAGTHTAGSLLKVEQCGQFYVSNITTSAFPAAGWRGIHFVNVSQTRLIGISVQTLLEKGAVFEDSIDIYMAQSRADVNAGGGWEVNTCSGVYWDSVSAFGNGGKGFNIISTIGGGAVLALAVTSFNYYKACISDTSGEENWNINGTESCFFSDCWGATQGNTTANTPGFRVNDCQGTEFYGTAAITNNGPGMIVTDSRIKIIGGEFTENGRVAGSTQRDGLVVGLDADVTIVGASLTDKDYFSAPKTQLFGLRVLSGAARLSVTGCDMTGNVSGSATFAATPAIFFESDNTTGDSPDVASASTVNLPYFGKLFNITGTTQINALGAQWLGREVTLRFSGASLLVADAGSLDIAGNMVTAAGDILSLMSDGSTWREVSRTYANGSISSRSAINTAWQYRSDGYNLHTIGPSNGSPLVNFLDFAAGAGIILVVDNADGAIALYLAGGGTVTKLGGAAKFVVGAPGITEIGLSYNAPNYRITNGPASPSTLYISGLAVRNTA